MFLFLFYYDLYWESHQPNIQYGRSDIAGNLDYFIIISEFVNVTHQAAVK